MSSNKTRLRKRYMRDLEAVAASVASVAKPVDLTVLQAFADSLAELAMLPDVQLREACRDALVPDGFTFLRMFDVSADRPFAMFARGDGGRLDVLGAVIVVSINLEDRDLVWHSTRVLPTCKPGVMDLEIASHPLDRPVDQRSLSTVRM